MAKLFLTIKSGEKIILTILFTLIICLTNISQPRVDIVNVKFFGKIIMFESSLLPSGVSKRILAGGKGDIPIFVDGGKVFFNYRAEIMNDDDTRTVLDDTKQQKQTFELLLGKQFKLDIWEKLLKTMRIDEIAEFVCDVSHVAAYPMVSKSWREVIHQKNHPNDHKHSHHEHQCGFAALNRGLGHTDLDEYLKNPKPIVFTIELLNVQQPGSYEKEVWSLSIDEKFNNVPKWKEEGNDFYKQKLYDKACEKYSQALAVLEQLCTREKPGTDSWKKIDEMKIPFLLNFAQCLICKNEYYQAIQHLTTVIEKDPKNVKAYFRRAKTYHLVFNYDDAEKDYNCLKTLDPSMEKMIEVELRKIQRDKKLKDKEDREKFKNAF